MKKIRNKLILLSAVMLIPFYSCEKKADVNNSFEIVPPIIEDAEAHNTELPIGGKKLSLEDIDSKFGKKLCNAAGCEFTEENINSVWFGENVFGVGLASVVYIGKYPEKLTDEDWELLCRIAESPSDYSQLLYNENAAMSDERLSVHAYQACRIPDSPYFDAMMNEIAKDYCAENGCTRDEAFRFLYTDGITVKTPYSADVQAVVDKVYADDSVFTDDLTNKPPQSACAVMDYSGAVIAAAGGTGGNTAYNRFYRIPHKIGSSIKPLSVYTPAIDEGILNFSSLVSDEPLILKNETETIKWPENYDGLNEGDITVTAALRKSKNTVAVNLAELLSPVFCRKYLCETFGFTTLTDNDASTAAMAMGALEKGAYVYELAAAYAVFGNGGTYYSPRFYDEVLDHEGNVILKKTSDGHRAVTEETSRIMNRLLYYNISTSDGIANAAAIDGIEVIGKTGTVTNSRNDDSGKLFAGGTPDLIAAVWEGFDDEEASISNENYRSPTLIWREIMKSLPCENAEFEPCGNIVERIYCKESGGLAVMTCREVERGYYTEDNIPNECKGH